MKKIFLILSFMVLLSSSLLGLSLFGAQDISKNYISENEMIDSYTQPMISCEKLDYFVIPIVNSIGEAVLFIPVSSLSSEVFISKTDSFNIKLVKSEFLLKDLINSNSSNYLSLQLIDKTSTLINSLNSKKAQLKGLSLKKYSSNVNTQITLTENNLNILITYLTEIQDNLTDLYSNQNSYLSNPDCDKSESLLISFDSSFKRYDQITQATSDYIQTSDLLITALVADGSIPSQEIAGIVSVASPSQSLNSQVSYIYESLSSTSAFYTNLSNNLKGNIGNQKIKIYIDNLILRKDYVLYKNVLETYDSSLPNYSNVDSAITTILDPENKSYWKEQDEVMAVQKLYTEMNSNFSKAEYSQAILKLNTIKLKAKTIIDSGFTEIPVQTNWFNYIFIGFIILILIILLIFIKKKGNKKNSYKKKSLKKKNDDFLKYDDPF
jgi:hypothetical protein